MLLFYQAVATYLGCCHQYGYGTFMMPCCHKYTPSLREHCMDDNIVGGKMNWYNTSC